MARYGRYGGLERPVAILGWYLPVAVVGLASLILFVSIASAVALRSGAGVLETAALVPGFVLRGQVWRLVTWIFFELDPLSLIFTVLMIAFFGRDLSGAWGAGRFLRVFVGLGVVSAVATCLVALAWRDVQATPYLGTWPVVAGVTVAWGALFPARQILFYFVLPVSGQILIYVTIATTLVFALMVGVSHFVPHFAAIGAALFYVRGLAALQTRLKVAQLVRAQKRRSSHLHVVKKGDRDDRPKWLH